MSSLALANNEDIPAGSFGAPSQFRKEFFGSSFIRIRVKIKSDSEHWSLVYFSMYVFCRSSSCTWASTRIAPTADRRPLKRLKRWSIVNTSVANTGCFSWILIFIHLGSRIQQEQQQKTGEHISCLIFFLSHKFYIIGIFFYRKNLSVH